MKSESIIINYNVIISVRLIKYNKRDKIMFEGRKGGGFGAGGAANLNFLSKLVGG